MRACANGVYRSNPLRAHSRHVPWRAGHIKTTPTHFARLHGAGDASSRTPTLRFEVHTAAGRTPGKPACSNDFDPCRRRLGRGCAVGAIRAADLGLKPLVIEDMLVGGTSPPGRGASDPLQRRHGARGPEGQRRRGLRLGAGVCAAAWPATSGCWPGVETARDGVPPGADRPPPRDAQVRRLLVRTSKARCPAGARWTRWTSTRKLSGTRRWRICGPPTRGQLIFGRMQMNASRRRPSWRGRAQGAGAGSIMLRYYPWRREDASDRCLTGGQA